VLRCSTTLTCLITLAAVDARLQDLERSFLRQLRAPKDAVPPPCGYTARPYGSSHAGSKAKDAQPYSVS
jgi:hypothetical protein